MTKEEYINKMKQHEIKFELLWRKIVDDTNDFKNNPEIICMHTFTNNIGRFIDTLCLSGAWIQDRLNNKKPKDRGSLTKNIRKVLGYTYP